LLIGGDNEKTQIDDLKNKPVVVIGTPGRILSLSKKNHLNLNNIQVFVIDECDKMLNALGKYISFFILKYYKNRYES
jgi:superfamily II DNA/RNA helicase